MTELLSTVRSKVAQSCVVSRCRKHGCSVALPGPARNRLLIDCDEQGSPFGLHDAKCDYLLFEAAQDGTVRAVPIELKSGRIRASDVIGQLRAGARAVENLIPPGTAIHLQPLLAYGEIPKGERAALNSGVVRFRGREVRISKIRCGGTLPTG